MKGREAGFSLIESLFAVAILCICVSFLVAANFRGSSAERKIADVILESLTDELLNEPGASASLTVGAPHERYYDRQAAIVPTTAPFHVQWNVTDTVMATDVTHHDIVYKKIDLTITWSTASGTKTASTTLWRK